MTDERLAEIKAREANLVFLANEPDKSKWDSMFKPVAYYSALIQISDYDLPELIAEVERLRVLIAEQRTAVAATVAQYRSHICCGVDQDIMKALDGVG